MRINDFVFGSTVDGEGIRNVVFVQGCRHRCAGCHNPSTHDFMAGKSMSENDIAETLISHWTRGEQLAITISGGDPFYQPSDLLELVRMLKIRHKANIWVYTGFRWEQLASRYGILRNIDVLVDGPFIEARRTLEIPFVGSDNQRIIDVQKSLAAGSVVLWHSPAEPEFDLLRGVL